MKLKSYKSFYNEEISSSVISIKKYIVMKSHFNFIILLLHLIHYFPAFFSFTCVCLKVRAENLKKEKEMLKLSEVRLSQQRESLLAEQRGQNLLLTNLQTIQVTK